VLALIRRRSAPGEVGLRRAERAYADRIGAELRRRGAHIQALLFVPDPERIRERAQATMARALRLAARRRGIDLGSSMLICDTWADVEAGLAAGCQPLLVMTGSGRAEINRPQTAGVRIQTWYAADLMMAALSVGAHFGSGDTLAGFSAPTAPGGRQAQPVA
jgi:histidinol phosphatase-like enzyme